MKSMSFAIYICYHLSFSISKSALLLSWSVSPITTTTKYMKTIRVPINALPMEAWTVILGTERSKVPLEIIRVVKKLLLQNSKLNSGAVK
jgi:hypothetical protein